MARIRTIKPEFWKHEDLSELPADTHMLAAALLNYSDDEGYFNANDRLIQAECFPLRELSVSIQDSLNALEKVGFLRFGTGTDGKQYGVVVKFNEHQRINRPTKSKIKDLIGHWFDSRNTHTPLTEHSLPERKGKEGKGKEKETPARNARGPIALDTFIADCQAVGELAIPPDDPVFDYCEQVKLPAEYVELAWFEFRDRMKGKRKKDWRAHFRNCIRGNWFKLWWLDGDSYALTTVGKQAKLKAQA